MAEPIASPPAFPEDLDATCDQEWRALAEQVLHARNSKNSSLTNEALRIASCREPEAPVVPTYCLWMADNLSCDGHYLEAVKHYDDCVSACSRSKVYTSLERIATGALFHKAGALELADDLEGALSAFRDLTVQDNNDDSAWFEAGRVAEGQLDMDSAYEFYNKVAEQDLTTETDNFSQLALRATMRLKTHESTYFSSPNDLAEHITNAIECDDREEMRRLASKTHFAVGPVGGHTGFETAEILEYFLQDMSASDVKAKRQLLGSGGKRYIPTVGWTGRWFSDEVTLIISHAPQGWQWTGVALHNPNDYWIEHWAPSKIETNDPLPFEIRAPWPEGECFTAGGLLEHIIEAGAVAAAWPLSPAVAFGFSAINCCGWGPRGYYYNFGPTHSNENAFAIDFTRYRRFVPYENESGGTPVLAVREGLVDFVRAYKSSGDSGRANKVHIHHADPANPSDTSRFTSKYLHLEGPFRIPVSQNMPVRLGTRLGFMDDTGNSILDHLHFSIHDRQLPHPDSTDGKSVRPSPMSGQTLGDGDSNKCIGSNNIDYTGGNAVLNPTSYAGQNWLITPAALAINEAPPRSIEDQKWLMVLSGVANIDFEGNGSQWLRETYWISPDLNAPMNHAINHYSIPKPQNSEFRLRFQVEQWVPHATPSSMFNKNHSVNSGFAVDVWRPSPFQTDTDVTTNADFGNVFTGMHVDVAVSDKDAIFYRLGYHIALLGRIRFGKPIIID